MGSAIGTIPYFSTYQPGALAIASTVYVEIVDSLSATSALSYNMSQQDFVGKAPSILPSANPTASDRIAFFQVITGLPRSCGIGDFGVPFGNLPTGGGVGTILVKNSITNYDASFTSTINIGTATFSGIVHAAASTISTSPDTGGLTVVGGVGIGGAINQGTSQLSLANFTPLASWSGMESYFMRKDTTDAHDFPGNAQYYYEWNDPTVTGASDDTAAASLVGWLDWTRPTPPSQGSFECLGVAGQVSVRGTGDTTHGIACGVSGQVFTLSPVQSVAPVTSLAGVGSDSEEIVSYSAGIIELNVTPTATNVVAYYCPSGNVLDGTYTNRYGVKIEDQTNTGATNTYAYWTDQADPGYAFYNAGTGPCIMGPSVSVTETYGFNGSGAIVETVAGYRILLDSAGIERFDWGTAADLTNYHTASTHQFSSYNFGATWAELKSTGLKIFNGVASTNSTTGDIVTVGGIGIGGNVNATGAYASSAPTTQTGATYSMGARDSSIIANRAGDVTLTLLSAASNIGRWLHVKTIQAQAVFSAGSNVVPLAGGAAGTTILAATAGKWASLQSDGSNWVIMAAA